MARAGIEDVDAGEDAGCPRLALHLPPVDPALLLHPEEEAIEQDEPCDRSKNPKEDFQQSADHRSEMGSESAKPKSYWNFTATPIAERPLPGPAGAYLISTTAS